jgi:hypothetical protein
MKNPTLSTALTTALLLSTLNSHLSTVFAQGSLTPPGAPAATMKTLEQIEPRTPVSSAPFTISVSGSYYLTTNLTVSSGDAIDINVSGVTLDLNGFTISSTAASAAGTAISLASALSDITIVNGHIRSGVTNNGSGVFSGSGFGYGINYSGTQPANVVVSKVSVAGVLNSGIYLSEGKASVVEACTVTTAGNYGIVASTVKGSVAIDCGNYAIEGDQVADCRGIVYNGGYGISATTALNCYGGSGSGTGLNANVAQNCYGNSSDGTGLSATTAQNCNGWSWSGNGFSVNDVAIGCSGWSYSSTGLIAYIALNCRGYAGGWNPGLSATMANSCYGSSISSTGLIATYGNFCFGSSVSVTTKYNMP